MAYVPLSRFLFRAPLLPVRAVGDRRQNLLEHPLGKSALALASPDLTSAVGRGVRASAALDRYRRRAAFRATPHGLWAGVGVGTVAPRSRIRTGSPEAVLRVAWWRLADLGRALLDVPELREQVRLRRAPSLVMGAHTILWLGAGQDGAFAEEKRADLDDWLDAVLRATKDWTSFALVRAALGSDSDAGDLDELLVTLIDDGLLHADVVPPLVGPEPGDWMRDRLARCAETAGVAARLAKLSAALGNGNLVEAQSALASLPRHRPTVVGERDASGVHATLIFPPPQPFTLSRLAIERAAALAPLLFRLQQALAPPISERTPRRGTSDALDATTETFGAGALDVGAFALGDYGVSPAGEGEPDDDDEAAVMAEPHPALIALLVDRTTDAARRGVPEIALRADEILPLLPEVATPASCELFVTPCRPRAGKPPGYGWLLGLHAPAGASWGRFAFALGDAASSLLEPLRDAERDARPGEEPVDVVFSPNDALADVCAHPPLRRTALALTGWPADERSALTPSELRLCADGGAIEPLALLASDSRPVSPSPLHRVRSATAPSGIWRLLVGWSLYRQHAPWALTWGPLAELAWTPRISLDGFVLAPASWRLPPALATRGPGPRPAGRPVRAWQSRAGVPRVIQVGSEDELLPVDLAAPAAAADLAGHERVYEIWPPLGDTPDESGRRVEAVVALVDQPDGDARARIEAAIAATAGAGAVAPPRHATGQHASEGWRTFKLFGATDRQNAVLLGAVHPALAAARRAREITEWFFLRYVDGPGRRPHLRVRVHLRVAPDDAPFAARLEAHLRPAIDAGDVVAIERAPYFPESARFGGPEAMPVIHRLFAADSDLACALLAATDASSEDPGVAGVDETRLLSFLVATLDALASGLGLDGPARRDLAQRRRAAHAWEVSAEMADAQAREFRTLRPRLRELLAARPASPHRGPIGDGDPGRALADFEERVRDAAAHLPNRTRDRILPSLLHLSAVRLAGLNRLDEMRAYTFWERTLESLERHGAPPRTSQS